MSPAWVLWMVIGYLSGSIPFALLLGFLKGVDVRAHGSGNVGATNLGRLAGRKWGLVCFALDAAKGAAPVALSGWQMGVWGKMEPAGDSWPWLGVALGAVLGHVFPLWLRFRGGKGVATGLGVVLGMWPILALPGLAAAATWLIVIAVCRYVSVASIIAATSMPIYLLVGTIMTGQTKSQAAPFLAATVAMALMVLLGHRGNVARLRAGTEPKVGQRRG